MALLTKKEFSIEIAKFFKGTSNFKSNEWIWEGSAGDIYIKICLKHRFSKEGRDSLLNINADYRGGRPLFGQYGFEAFYSRKLDGGVYGKAHNCAMCISSDADIYFAKISLDVDSKDKMWSRLGFPPVDVKVQRHALMINTKESVLTSKVLAKYLAFIPPESTAKT